MLNLEALKNRIFSISSRDEFNALTLEIFSFQYENNAVYQQFCDYLGANPNNVGRLEQIPFLPIELFKNHRIVSGNGKIEFTFESSGTTGAATSKHHLLSTVIYEESFSKAFRQFYGNPEDYRILALLPNYLERSGSSLVYMANQLILESKHPESGFFLDDTASLRKILQNESDKKTLLIGVSFALLDLVEEGTMQLKNTVVMETGGMKGRRKELTRNELHEILKSGFGVASIHSEYGMTELLSQAYASANGEFECPNWMKLLIRDTNDPFGAAPIGKTGGLNVIDLANLYSCSFIATSDLGRALENGKVEVLGRFDYSDMRGCNLMI
ncbi:acyl transferase [Cryomorpha ignava]|uniref:Acyl transferase n=1 Tax=Cryomorpha ignava TaxID=101383 RepID=A0A7K3WTC9_9FLAO|nr:acyl transferase [Cryomorpha ignava]NEN24949.1 acyl transferase [Cryomorpha ignava]